jgi:hypothetical protein
MSKSHSKAFRLQPDLKHWGGTILLLLAFFGQIVLAGPKLSLTADEPVHMAQGYVYWTRGDFRFQEAIAQPPLPDLLAGLGLLLQPGPAPESLPGWDSADSVRFDREFVKWYGPALESATLAARLPLALIATLGVALVFRWARDQFGRASGLLALALCAFDPNLLAHAGLAATDVLLTVWGFAGVYAATQWTRKQAGWRWGIATGVALGLALGSKTSGFFPVGIVGLLLATHWVQAAWHARTSGWRAVIRILIQWAVRFAGIGAIALFTLWALYLFEVKPLPGSHIPVPLATHWLLWRALRTHLAEGHTAFLAGQISAKGWWSYYPVAFVLKTPLPTLALLGAAIAGLIVAPRQSWQHRGIWLFPLLYGAASLASTIAIGYRYLIAALPFLYVLTGRLWIPRANWRKAVILIGLIWLMAGTLAIFPHHLTFFNELAGGPTEGYHSLVDSNLDWGQSFIALRDWLADQKYADNIFLSYYTFADPALYKIRYTPIAPSPGAPPVLPSRFNPAPGVYALSATPLQGVMVVDPDMYSWFRLRQPVARPGGAIFVYRVQAPPSRPTWLAQCTQPAPPLEPDVIIEGFGRQDLRVAYFDCATSWLVPAGGQAPGWYALHRAASTLGDSFINRWLNRTKLSYEQRANRASPAFSVYEQSATSPGAPCSATPITWDGPLAFRGYAVSRQTARPGETVEVETCWQVIAQPGRPLSLMLHAVEPGPGSHLVADGLGVPIEQWRAGDWIVQRHTLQIPLDAPAGRYPLLTGAYWLDTLERWHTASGADTLDLVPITVRSR